MVVKTGLELSALEEKDQQMLDLFRGYQTYKPIKITKLKDKTRVVILSDAQIPFNDLGLIGGTKKGKYGAVERFISDYDPDIIAINGDWLDAYTISSFSKAPNRKFTLKDEIKLACNTLETLNKAAPRARKIFGAGNHEYRIQRAAIEACQKSNAAFELFGVSDFKGLDVQSMMHLTDLGWEYFPYGNHVDLLGFVIAHGSIVASEAGVTARRMYLKYHSSGTSGHTHRAAVYTHTDGTGKEHVWIESGCLCRKDLEYLHGETPNWTQAFVIGEVNNNKLHTSLITAFDNRFWVPNMGTYKFG